MKTATVLSAGIDNAGKAFLIHVTARIEQIDLYVLPTSVTLPGVTLQDARLAVESYGYHWPMLAKISIEVVPECPPDCDRYTAPGLVLPIAVAVLRASGQLKDAIPNLFDEDNVNAPIFYGGLDYDGSLTIVRSAIPVALDLPGRLIVTSPDNAIEIAIACPSHGAPVFKTLRDVVAMLHGEPFVNNLENSK